MEKMKYKKDYSKFEHKNKKFYVRPETLDIYVIKENQYQNCNFEESDVWFDIGGNIGIFPVWFANKVHKIISFEPDTENYKLFLRNIRLNQIRNCKVMRKAVIGSNDRIIPFFLNDKKNKGSHSTLVKKGRTKTTVHATNINEELRKYNPNKLKIDIEGGEYNLLFAIDDFNDINEIIFEYHINILKDHKGIKLRKLYNLLKSNGYQIVKGKHPDKLGKNWFTIIHIKKQKKV